VADRSSLGLIDLFLLSLATWRLSRMVTEEDGPANVFRGMRERVGAEDNGVAMPWDELSSFGKIAQCPHCVSVWLAAALLLLRLISLPTYNLAVLSLFGSSVTVFIEEAKQ